ncbi:MAG: prolipoprotein diacylglyceryl transferase [Candidatus Firestonebacteria bacterium GWA2_43_8]|nr:MAG: prolipoprotein diacylglyceryl transferase [Candidatus Firestonebacteria bacterium GWA2_43_8]
MYPELFKIGSLTIYSYGLFVALGFLAATWIAGRRAKAAGILPEKMLDINIYSFLAGIIGARILYVLTEYKYYMEYPGQILKIWEGGLVFYGSLIGGVLFFFWYVKRQKLDVLLVSDIIIPAVALGQALGRLGCFMRGCCYGKPVEYFGIIFPDIGDKIPHIPTQLIEAAAMLGIFFFLHYRKPKFKGEIFALYLLLYGVARFAIEFLRGDDRGPMFFNTVSVSQFISLLAVAFGFVLYRRFKAKKT